MSKKVVIVPDLPVNFFYLEEPNEKYAAIKDIVFVNAEYIIDYINDSPSRKAEENPKTGASIEANKYIGEVVINVAS